MPIQRPSAAANGTRLAAARVLAAWIKLGEFPERMLEGTGPARAETAELVLGVTRWYGQLDWLRGKLAPRRPKPDAAASLLVGLYELLHHPNAAPHAVVNENVAAAKALAGRRARNFVNAVLRSYLRERKQWDDALAAAPDHVQCAHPELLLERWRARYGNDALARLCAWNNTPAATWIFLRPARVKPATFHRRIADAGLELDPRRGGPEGFFRLPRGVAVSDLPGYREGWFNVQDPATWAAVDLLAPRPGERVLDACAAPGGKTALIADRLEGRGELLATDLHEDRLALLRENLLRLKIDQVKVERRDWRQPIDDLGAFDAVLLDVPCSNTGVIRRRPDVRWRFGLPRMARLAATQRSVLDAASRVVKPGGRLVYSTCSLEPEENELQIESWLKDHAEFQLAEKRLLFPPESNTDGAFAALVKRMG